MNWGWKIVFVYVGFIGFITYLIYRCTHENTDLVTEDYYGKELAFTDQYNREKNSNDPGMKMDIRLENESKTVVFTFPPAVRDSQLTGEIKFYRPDDKKLDFSLPLKSGADQTVDCAALKSGRWKIQVNWNTASRGFYQADEIFIH